MQPKLGHEHAFFFLELGHHNFFFAPSGQETKAKKWNSSLLTFNSVKRRLCAPQQVFWKHSILILQDYLQVFFLFEKGGIHKSTAKARIFPALVALSGVVLCYEEPVLCCHGLLSCLATVGTCRPCFFFWYVRCRERAKAAGYPAMYWHMNKVFGFRWLGRH